MRREGGADKDCLVPPSMLSATAVVGGDLSRCACCFADGLAFAGLPILVSVCTRVGEVSVLSQRVKFFCWKRGRGDAPKIDDSNGVVGRLQILDGYVARVHSCSTYFERRPSIAFSGSWYFVRGRWQAGGSRTELIVWVEGR